MIIIGSEVGGSTSDVGRGTSEVPFKGKKGQHCFALPVFCIDLHKNPATSDITYPSIY